MSIPTGSAIPSDSVSAENAAALTPSDSFTFLATRGLWVGGGGNVAVVMANDSSAAVTFTNVAPGTVLPLRVTKVMNTNTTATGIVGLW